MEGEREGGILDHNGVPEGVGSGYWRVLELEVPLEELQISLAYVCLSTPNMPVRSWEQQVERQWLSDHPEMLSAGGDQRSTF